MKLFLMIFFSTILFGYNVEWIRTNDGCLIAYPYLLINKKVTTITYIGRCKNNKVDGKKIIIHFKDGKLGEFSGKIKNGYFTGLGQFKFKDGSFFAGLWNKSYLKGEFNFKLSNGGYYQCEFNGNLKCKGAAANFGKSRQAALNRWMGAYVKDVIKNTKKDLQYSSNSSYKNNNSNIKIKYERYEKWCKHYDYGIYINNQYDGEIFYYWDSSNNNYTFMTTGTSHSIIGSYYPNLSYDNMHTPKCGDFTVSNVQEAIEKAVNCAYKGHY